MSNQPRASVYYFRIRGRVEGPFDLARAQTLVRRGRLSRYHEVSTDRVHWRRATQFPELFVAQVEEKVRVIPLEETAAESQPAESAEPLWYYSSGGREQGPVPLSQLVQMAQSGQLEPDSLVWTDGMEQWAPWRNVPALKKAYAGDNAAAAVEEPATRTTGVQSPRPSLSGMAITSLILGSVSWGVLLVLLAALVLPLPLVGLVLLVAATVSCVIAVVLAHLALSHLRRHPRVLGRGIGITGLVLGYAGITVTATFLILLIVGAAVLGNLQRLLD